MAGDLESGRQEEPRQFLGMNVRWPSGKTHTLTNVAANQILNVQKP
jgi:hypothetical protein